MCWLRSQNMRTTKDFKAECEWKWLVNNNSEILHVKENNKHECEKEEDDIEEYCEGTIVVHVNDKLLIIGKNSNFQEMLQEDAIRIVFSEEIKQAIIENEATAATDASIKD